MFRRQFGLSGQMLRSNSEGAFLIPFERARLQGAAEFSHPSFVAFCRVKSHRAHSPRNRIQCLLIPEDFFVYAGGCGIEFFGIASEAVNGHNIAGRQVSPAPRRPQRSIVTDDFDLSIGRLEDSLKGAGALVFAVEKDPPDSFFELVEYSIGAWGSLIATPLRKSVRARSWMSFISRSWLRKSDLMSQPCPMSCLERPSCCRWRRRASSAAVADVPTSLYTGLLA